jgi:hypothetical protein
VRNGVAAAFSRSGESVLMIDLLWSNSTARGGPDSFKI